MSSITWNKIGNTFLVESADHLEQMMRRGSGYTITGETPSWTTSSFMQTVDIDLINVQSFCRPLFSESVTTTNTGNYNGGGYTISNWSYTGNNRDYVALFGYCRGGTIQNVKLRGVWNVTQVRDSAAFLVAGCYNTTIKNCDAVLDPGSIISPSTTNGIHGGMIGNADNNVTLEGISIGGTFDISNGGITFGGVVGRIDNSPIVRFLRNTATITGLQATQVAGGVIGQVLDTSCITLICAMIGDIVVTSSSGNSGGVIGDFIHSIERVRFTLSRLFNSMTGDIIGSTSGGILGDVLVNNYARSNTFSFFGNYMTGNCTDGMLSSVNISTGVKANASIGQFGPATVNASNFVVAMNGTASHAVASNPTSFATSKAHVDTSFGMVFTSTNNWTSENSFGIAHPSFPDLGYIDLVDTPTTVEYKWDFIFGNLSGKPAYSSYTHLSVHTGDVSVLFPTTFDIDAGNTIYYATFANANTNTLFLTTDTIPVLNSGASSILNATGILIFPPPPMTISVRSINTIVDISPIENALGYRVTYQQSGSREVLARSSDQSIKKNISSLLPDTDYIIRLYVNTGSGFNLEDTQSITTLEDVDEGYVIQDFLEDGVYRIEDFSVESRVNISSRLNNLLVTGDNLEVSTKSKSQLRTKFVNRGGNSDTKENLLIPFDENSGSSQEISITLEDGVTIVPISYDETSNTINVDSVEHSVGDVFVIDGKKCTVIEYDE